MFTGEFAAGAGALKGHFAQVDGRLVRFGTATLTFAPEGEFVRAEHRPFVWRDQTLGCFGRRGIGGQRQHLFTLPLHGGSAHFACVGKIA